MLLFIFLFNVFFFLILKKKDSSERKNSLCDRVHLWSLPSAIAAAETAAASGSAIS